MATPFTIADTSELISMALSDKVTFNDIKAKFNIDESEVKRAIDLLNKAQKQRIQQTQREAYASFMTNL